MYQKQLTSALTGRSCRRACYANVREQRLNDMNSGKKFREQRITENYSGVWGSSSQDFVRLAFMLFKQSADYARNTDKNCSVYTLAGIPMLLSALRCLLIELNSNMHSQMRIIPSEDLAKSANDIQLVIDNYKLHEDLKSNLKYLIELRHEIIHPSHKPTGTRNNTPSYLSAIREKGLLQSTGEPFDYIWTSQLLSHKLFRWAFEQITNTVKLLLSQHEVGEDIANGIYESYSKY